MSLRSAIGTMILGKVIAQVISVFGVFILAQLYNPADFGYFSSFLAVATIIGSVSSWRYDLSILMSRSVAGSHFAAVLAIGISIVTITALAAVATILALMGILNGKYVIALVLMTSGIAILNISAFTQSRKKRYQRQVAIELARPIGLILLGILFFYFPISDSGLVDASAISLLILGFLVLAVEYRRYPWKAFLSKRRSIRIWLAHYRDLPRYAAPAVLLNTLSMASPPILIMWLFGPTLAGLFALTMRIVGMPASTISRAVNVVYQREVAERKNESFRILPMTLKIFSIMTITSVGIFLILVYIIRKDYLQIIFSTEWQELGRYVLIASPMLVARFVAGSVAGFGVLGYSSVGLLIQGLNFFMVISSLFFAYLIGASGDRVIGALSWSLAFASFVQIVVTFWITRNVDLKRFPGRFL